MTQEQKDNLLKLATYLLSGNLKAEFDMRHYSQWHDALIAVEKTDCGTIGCSAGHGPYAGIPKESGESWYHYISRVFGIGVFSWQYDFVFSSQWGSIDNTPQGAGKRILYMLRKGGLGISFFNFSSDMVDEYSQEKL